jgi:acetyl-CoA carboxylase carboxyltransferase component
MAEGVDGLDAVGRVFAAMVRASGRVPQIAVVLGPTVGDAAFGLALTDIVIMSGAGCGCLDASGADKAARFVLMCDSFCVPLVVLVDMPGYLPGLGQEWNGVVRRGATLLFAFAGAVVPRVTVVTRKAYGGAYMAMNSRALGATAVFAWPTAELAVMGAVAAVDILHRRALAAVAPQEREVLRDGWSRSTSGSPAASTRHWRPGWSMS